MSYRHQERAGTEREASWERGEGGAENTPTRGSRPCKEPRRQQCRPHERDHCMSSAGTHGRSAWLDHRSRGVARWEQRGQKAQQRFGESLDFLSTEGGGPCRIGREKLGLSTSHPGSKISNVGTVVRSEPRQFTMVTVGLCPPEKQLLTLTLRPQLQGQGEASCGQTQRSTCAV